MAEVRRSYNLFGRRYELRISQPTIVTVSSDEGDMSPKAVEERRLAAATQRAYQTSPQVQPVAIERDTILITDLQIKASVYTSKSDSGNNSNQTTITIYNASPDTLGRIGAGKLVFLDAGYDQDEVLPNIYSGEISHVTNERIGNNTITTLFCEEFRAQRSDIKISRSWPAGTSYDEILTSLLNTAKDKGVPIGRREVPDGEGIRIAQTFVQSGYAVHGQNLFNVIDTIAREVNYRAYFTNGSYYVEPVSAPKLVNVINVSDINVKEFIKTRETWDSSEKKYFNGVVLKLFLDGVVRPDGILRIDEDGKQVEYVIKKVSHFLDYEGSWWETEVEADIIE